MNAPEAPAHRSPYAPLEPGARRGVADGDLAAAQSTNPDSAKMPGAPWARRLAWLPVPLLLVPVLCLHAAGLRISFEAPFLVLAMNFITGALASVFIAYLAGRSFLARSSPGVLLLGCGALAWGAAGVMANLVGHADPNLDVLVHNCGVWISALFHLVGAVWLLQPRRQVRGGVAWLGAGYIGALGAVGLGALWGLHGHAPVFFVPGVGGTLARQAVLASAIVMFGLAAVFIGASSRGTKSVFPFWYIAALAAIAVGLLGLLLQTTIGGLLPWTGRAAMWLGGVYMVLAALASVGESGVWAGHLEEALRESEERFARLARQAPVGIVETDAQGGCLFVNDCWQAMTGLSAAQAAGQGWREAIHPEDRERVRAAWSAAIQAQGEFASEHRLRTPSGRITWVMANATPIRHASGAVRGYLRTVLDITARKQREIVLQQLSRTLKALGQSNAAMMRATSEQELLQAVCSIVVEDCGHAMVWIGFREEDAAQSVRPVAHAGFEQGYLETLQVSWAENERGRGPTGTALRTGKVCQCQDMRSEPSFGPWREQSLRRGYASSLVLPLLADGLAFGAMTIYSRQPAAFAEDEVKLLTELANDLAYGISAVRLRLARTRAEEALRESERQLRALADSIPNLAWWAKGDGNITWYNRRWYEYTGTTPEQMEGWGWQSVHDPKRLPQVLERWAEAIAAGEPFEMEFALRGADGRFGWFLTRVVPVKDAAGKVARWFGTNTDVTELREAQQLLSRSNAELERLVAERTAKLQELVAELEHFSYTITHDMRAPLRAMMGFGELVNDMCAECAQPELKAFLRKIMTSAQRMDALIRDALNYNRSVRQELPLEEVDTGALLRGMLDSYPELQASRARIRIEGELPVVLGNEAGMTQCFSNLLGNAVKFVNPGAMPEIRIWAELVDGAELIADRSATQPSPGYQPSTINHQLVRIWVEDNGIGISKQMLPRVFDMFSRGSTKYEGTGIGLALVRKVAHRMGGQAGVESEEGQGSRFWVQLRSARAEGKARRPDLR